MRENSLRAEIDLLERRLQLLLDNYKRVKAELDIQKNENNKLNQTLKLKDKQINDFQNKIKISKIVDSIHDEGNNMPELRKLIDEYIKEIDKCILHLSK
jgi:hypothetical protein